MTPIRHTSMEWQQLLPYPKVVDPDGWDRRNIDFSWYEERITLAEYERRLALSTVQQYA